MPEPKSDPRIVRLVAKKKFHWICLLLIFAILSITAPLIYYSDGMANLFFSDKYAAVSVVFLILICCITLFVFVTHLIPGSSYIELTPKGFTYCGLYLRKMYRWENVSRLRVGLASDCIVFDLLNGRSSGFANRVYRAWSRHEFTADGYILGKFKMVSQDLIELLDEWRERYSDTNAYNSE